MTQDEIIEMARQAGFDFNQMSNSLYTVRGNYAQLEAFANLVAAKEREACTKVVQIHLEASDDLRTKGTLASVLDYIKYGWSLSEDYYPVIKDIEAKLKERNT